jgi:hypothetical protein
MALSKIDMSKMVTGTLPVASGGTGLTSGTSGQFLKFTGTTTIATGEAGGGKINQVIQTIFSTDTDFAATSFQNISGGGNSLSATITPTATNSKVYVNYTIQAQHNSNRGYKTRILRGVSGSDTEIFAQPNQKDTYGDGDVNASRSSVQFLDSPNTTSACEYMIQIGTDGAQTVTVAQSGSQCMITLMEVLA